MATTLSAGDIAIIGFNFDNPDELSFVLLTDITAGTEITFTDNGWQSSGEFRANEGTFTWTAASDFTKGSVINSDVSGVAFSGSGDQIIAFQGLSDTPTFIYALNSEGSGIWQTDATSSNTSALPTGLTNGETAVALDEIDNAVYNGTTSGTKAELLAAISNKDNWLGSDSDRQTLPTGKFTVNDGGTQALVINEVLGSTTGADVEYIELFGEAGTSLDGYSIIVVESDEGSDNGTIDKRVDLGAEDVIGDNGFFLIGNSLVEGAYSVTPDKEIESNFIENSSYTIALVETSSLTGTSVSGSEVVLDAVGATDGDGTDSFFFNAPVLGPDGTFLPAGVRRVADGVDTDTADDWVFGDFNLGSDNTPTAGAGDNGGGGEEPTLTSIYEIQGESHTSPLLGESVTTTGIVTAVDSNGFYLQDATGDNNDATSDALFVFTGSSPTVAVGDDVEVTGTVSEFFPGGEDTGNLSTTQISGNPSVTVNSSGNALPAATIIGTGGRVPPTENIDDDAFASFEPNTDGIDFFESLEGMRVTAQDAVAVAPTNRFGEIFTVVDNGEGATGISERGTLNISPDDFNPEKVQIDEDSEIFDFDLPDVNVGAQLGDVTGVVGYSFGNFEIYPTEDFTANVVESTIQPETTTIEGGADKLTVASYNVLNLDPNDADGDTDVANGRFDAIANQIVNNLKTPDVIGLQEIQDNNGSDDAGVTSADQTLQQLVDAIAAAGGPTYSFIDNTFIGNDTSGGQPVGNIRTAFLYNPERVGLVEGSVESIQNTEQQTNEDNPFFDSRLPIVAKFTFNGEEVTVVNNHFSSKGGSSPILGVEQPFEQRQEEVEVNGSLDERQAQANAVKGYVDGILTADANANVVVLGDLNEFEFVSPVETLADNLTNLTETVSEDERYSFIFQGNSQSLDHILVSDNLAGEADFDIVQVNSEFADTVQKASDHDPLVASLSIRNQNAQNQNMVNFAGTVELEGAEISAYDSGTQRIFVTGEAGENNAFNIAQDSPILQAVDVSDPSNPTVIGQIDLSSYGAGVQSVAVNNGVVAVAVSAETSTEPGKVVFFNASDYSELSQVEVGVLPDMLTFTPDGMKVLVANEGEPNDDYTVDPEGSISIIDVSDISTPTVTTADFTAFNGQEDTLRSEGVRIFGKKADGTMSSAAEDFEPEYIAVSADGTAAFVALQENNAFAVLDIASATVTDILPLGFKDWSGANPTLKPFKATFEGSQEVTPNTSTAAGSALLQLNQAGDALSYTMTIEGLDFGELAGGEAQTTDTGDDVTGIHFHNAARGEGGSVVFGIVGPEQDTDDRTISINDDGSTTISGVWETTDTEASESLTNFVADLQAANTDEDVDLYFNIHTEEFPMGEIRGQVMGASVELDASNRDGDGDGEINFANYPILGMYQPDAIASYEANGETYYVTANEGDARDYDGFSEEVRVGDDEIILDPTAFPDAATLQQDENLGRLKTTTALGDTDGDGDFDEIYAYGGRSFSIFNSSGELVYDSGDLIGKLTAELVPEKFNSQGTADSFDSRSDDKGAEPEGVTVGEVGGKTYAYVGLERTGGVMVFDVSNPTAASFVQYVNNEGDRSPEGLTFIDAEDSANGNSLLAVTNEVSETLSIYNAGTESTDTYTLQILHASDLEGGVDAIDSAANFAAIVDKFEEEVDNTIVLSAGDNYIPGPFFGAAGDRSLRTPLQEFYQEFYNEAGLTNIREGVGRVDISIMNAIGFDASAVGNHEFDAGTNAFGDIIGTDIRGSELSDARWLGAQFPYLSANLDFSADSNLSGLYTSDILANTEFQSTPDDLTAAAAAPKIAPATVIEEGGERIGVVGATTQLVETISSTGDVDVIDPESNDMAALAAILQPTIDQLIADGINKVVVVSHLQQITLEKELISQLSGVDVVIAGGSDTLQADSTDVLRNGDVAEEGYPFETTNKDGDPAVIVSTDGEYSYVGRLVVNFDSEGKVILDSIDEEVSGAYATDEAGLEAVYGENVDDAFAEGSKGEQVRTLTEAVETVVTENDGIIYGKTDVFLEGRRSEVRTEETNFGNLTADANLAAAKAVDESVVISIKNGGGIRAEIGSIDGTTGELGTTIANPDAGKEAGEISQLDLENSLRFNNGLTLLTVTAQELLDIIEHSVADSGDGNTPGRFPQVSGLQFSFDDDLPAGDRVQSLAVVDEDGNVLDVIAENGELVGDTSRTLRIVTLNFLAGGGDGYPFPEGESANRVDLVEEGAARTGFATAADDGSEQDALAEYLVENFAGTPFDIEDVSPAEDMRIQNLDFREDTVLDGVEIGGENDDEITSDKEFIDAGEGNNTINAGAGNNRIKAGAGNDTINAGEGDNTIDAGAGDNTITAGEGNDTIDAGEGNDTINPGAGNNIVNAGAGNDNIVGGQGENRIDGGEGEDTVIYNGNQDDFEIERMGDEIKVGSNTDTLTNVEILEFNDGSLNTSEIVEEKEISLVSGTPEADTLIAGLDGFDAVGETVFTGAGADEVDLFGGNNNRVNGGSGNDEIFVSSRDRVFGGAGNDILDATDSMGRNRMSGGEGDDTFLLGMNDRALGGAGNDIFFVQSGGDNILSGGEGDDQFWIASAEIAASANTIVDFEMGTDVIGILGSASLGIDTNTLELKEMYGNTEIAFGGQTLAMLNGVTGLDVNTSLVFN